MRKKGLDENKDLTNSKAPEELVTIEEEELKEEKPVSGFKKKLKYGSMFYIAIILVVAIVVALNFMVSVIGKRSPIKIDITPDDRYELSAESINAVKSLDSEVEVTVTAARDYFTSLGNYWESYYANYGYQVEMPFEMIPELLDKYSVYAEQGNGSIKVKYVDMDVDPDIVNRYKEYYNGDIERGSIIVYSDERVRVLTPTDVMNMLSVDQYALQTTGETKFSFTGESAITSAVNNVVNADPVRVAFAATMNHAPMYDEQSYSDAAGALREEILSKNGYDCTDIDIATDDISPEDYDMVVVFAPSVDFTENIITKLSDFLYNGGKYSKGMVYVPDFTKTNLPNIEEFLANWSIKVENNIIADDKYNIGSATTIALRVGDSDAVGKLPNDKLPVVSPYTRELKRITKNNEDIVKTVLSTYDEAYTVSLTDKNEEVGEMEERPAVILSQKQAAEQINVYTSSLLVIGSPYMFDSMVISQNTTYNNANVLLNTMNIMMGRGSGVVIPDKNLQYPVITPTTKQARNIQIIVVWVIPIIIAFIGVIVLLRRRNK